MHKNGNRGRERLAEVAALLLRCLKVKIYNKTGCVLCKTAKRYKHEKMTNLMLTFYINLFPKKVEYAILLQKSCLMEAEIFEIGRETLTDSWQKNCNRHCRKPGEKECSG